jgi:anti-sigma-K factor RskA
VDVNAYIESGAIESYVLGLATPDEARETELLAATYPEIAQALDAFAYSIEKTAQQQTIAPAPEVKDRLFEQLETEFAAPELSSTTIAPIQSQAKLVRMPSYLRWLSAASVILLLGSAAFNYYLYQKVKRINGSYQALLSEKTGLEANNKTLNTSLKMATDTAVLRINLMGVKGFENSFATVLWHKNTKDVYFLNNQLPQAPKGKQYQLWALVSGKPVDAGMVSNCENNICKMNNMPQADAFAITLEKEGGSPTPDLTQLTVVGGVTR